jgi:hypothetical protein
MKEKYHCFSQKELYVGMSLSLPSNYREGRNTNMPYMMPIIYVDWDGIEESTDPGISPRIDAPIAPGQPHSAGQSIKPLTSSN